MELIERPDFRATHFLNSIPYDTFRNQCIDDADINKIERPTDDDCQVWFKQLKGFCRSVIESKGSITRIYRTAKNIPATLGGRLFCPHSIQGIWNKYRGLVMRDISTDIDMTNAHPTILRYLCNIHHIRCPALDYYIENRKACYNKFDSDKQAKRLYLIAMNSNMPLKLKNKPQHFKEFESEIHSIQKQLCSIPEYKQFVDSVPEDKKSNFEGSAVNRILCYYENIILGHAIHVINSHNIEIAVLMFDGLMIYGNHYENKQLLEDIEEYVENKFPRLKMKWTYKPHDTSIDVPDDFNENNYTPSTMCYIVSTDEEAANLLLSQLENVLVADKQGRLFYKHENIWVADSERIRTHLMTYILSSGIYKQSAKGIPIPFSQNISGAKNIYAALCDFVKIKNVVDIYEKFHSTTKGRLCFKDGVLDFKTKRFVLWENLDFEIYSCQCIPYEYNNYFKNPNLQTIETVKQSIFESMFGNDTQLALHFLSRVIAGHCEDKKWATYLGNRDCGKGIIYEALKSAFSDYVQTFELKYILYQRNTVVDNTEIGKKLYWLLNLEFCRLAISQETPEVSTGLRASGLLIKKIHGGSDEHVARRNYDRCDTHFKIDTTMMIFGNAELQVDSNDVNEHRLQFRGVKQYKSAEYIQSLRDAGEHQLVIDSYTVADPTLKDKCHTDDWKRAVVYLLYSNYSNKAVEVPKPDEDDIECYSVRKLILEQYEITKLATDMCSIQDVYTNVGEEKKKIHAELESMGVTKKKVTTKSHPLYGKYVYSGLKEKYPMNTVTVSESVSTVSVN